MLTSVLFRQVITVPGPDRSLRTSTTTTACVSSTFLLQSPIHLHPLHTRKSHHIRKAYMPSMTEENEPPVQVPSARGTSSDDQNFEFARKDRRYRTPSLHYPRNPTKPTLEPARSTLENISNSCLATNGPLATSARASPAPQGGPPVPNGKPTSPYNERQNPLTPNAQIAAQTVSSKDPKAAAQAASDMRNVVRRKLTGYVGFANLPNQWHRKSVRKGFNFNVMVVGTSILSLCKASV